MNYADLSRWSGYKSTHDNCIDMGGQGITECPKERPERNVRDLKHITFVSPVEFRVPYGARYMLGADTKVPNLPDKLYMQLTNEQICGVVLAKQPETMEAWFAIRRSVGTSRCQSECEAAVLRGRREYQEEMEYRKNHAN